MHAIRVSSRVLLSVLLLLLGACSSEQTPVQARQAVMPPRTAEASERNDQRMASPVAGCATIGHLKTRDHWVTISAGPDGALYTIKTEDGRVLLHGATDQELQARLPDVHRRVSTGIAGCAWAGLWITRQELDREAARKLGLRAGRSVDGHDVIQGADVNGTVRSVRPASPESLELR